MRQRIGTSNDRLAAWATTRFGSMWLVYAFFVVPLVTLLLPPGLRGAVFFLASGWIQLWALPLLLVGSVVLGRAAERRAQEDHETLLAELAELKAMHEDMHALLKERQAA